MGALGVGEKGYTKLLVPECPQRSMYVCIDMAGYNCCGYALAYVVCTGHLWLVDTVYALAYLATDAQ
jgi:hypothetical protein